MWSTVMLLQSLGLLLLGVAIGIGMTWWRWRMAVELADRALQWDKTALAVRRDVGRQIRHIEKLDYTLGTLAALLKAHLRMSAPEHMRSAIARMVGEEAPEKPQPGWDTPLPEFDSGGLSKIGNRRSASGPPAS